MNSKIKLGLGLFLFGASLLLGNFFSPSGSLFAADVGSQIGSDCQFEFKIGNQDSSFSNAASERGYLPTDQGGGSTDTYGPKYLYIDSLGCNVGPIDIASIHRPDSRYIFQSSAGFILPYGTAGTTSFDSLIFTDAPFSDRDLQDYSNINPRVGNYFILSGNKIVGKQLAQDFLASADSPASTRPDVPVVEGGISQDSINEIESEAAAGNEEDTSCESNTGALGWILCPIAEILDGVVDWLDKTIQDLLIVREDRYDNDGLFAAWKNVRNIAYIILIPIMLVMVIGTALGFEIFSAYTIKRALPRMVIAVIFITLSWYICIFLIDFINVIGTGILGLITAPFNSANDGAGVSEGLRGALETAEIVGSGGNAADTASSGLGLVAIVGGSIFAGFATGVISLGIILSTLVSAALVLGVMFLLLVARQMFILMLILAAPLAILAWIFPGNDKGWKIWWSSFSKLLLMFPLIMALLGVGRVFANIVATSAAADDENTIVTTIIIIAAYIIPFLAIPFAFKWVGGAFGNLAGMVNDKNRGLLDRGKKKRAEKRAEGYQNFKAGTGTGFGQKNAFARRAGMGVGAGAFGGKGFLGYGDKGKARLDQMNRQNAMDQVMKNPAWSGVNQDDNALHAGIMLQDKGMTRQKAIDEMTARLGGDDKAKVEATRAVNAWGASGLGGRAAAVAAAQQLVSTGTGYKNIEDMSSTLARASGGNTSTATALAGFANSETKKTGRHDLSPGFSNLNSIVQDYVTPGGAPSADKLAAARTEAWNSGSLYEHANDKPANLKAHIEHFESELSSTDAGRREKAATFFTELKSMKPNAKGGNADIINAALDSNASRVQAAIASLPPTPYSPDTVRPVAGPAMVTDPLTGETKREVIASRQETSQERVERMAKTYERPDPNRM